MNTELPMVVPIATARKLAKSRTLPAMVAGVSLIILIVAAVSQSVGALPIHMGVVSITLLPMLWGLVACTIISAQRAIPFSDNMVKIAQKLMDAVVLILCARLAFTMGPNIMMLFRAGPALLLQEFGHMFGTILLALPLAVLLKMGPATVGATFSIDREGSFAMVPDRYGTDSPQYRGMLAMYIFGTLFGTIIVSLIASVTSSLHIFDPLALAMGAGVGSGSMMAAATGAIVAEHPDMSDQVLAAAATSNVITGLLGVYVGIYIALPLAEKLYNKLAHDNVHPISRETAKAEAAKTAGEDKALNLPMVVAFVILLVIGCVVSSIAVKSVSWQLVTGYVICAVLAGFGVMLAPVFRNKIPPLVIVITLGVLISCPASPIATPLVALANKVDFLSICTVVLTTAGLTVGTKLGLLKGLGWRIIPVGTVSVAASYLLSVCVAELALGLWG